NTFTVTGALQGSGNLTKSGAGVLLLANSPSYGGSTIVSGGILRLANGAGNNRVLKTTGITVSSGQLDVTDNKLIVSGAASASTFSGGSYGGVAGLVAAGRNGGTWDGTGIITSQSNAASPSVLTGLAVASADELGRVGQTFG